MSAFGGETDIPLAVQMSAYDPEADMLPWRKNDDLPRIGYCRERADEVIE